MISAADYVGSWISKEIATCDIAMRRLQDGVQLEPQS